MVSSSFKDSVSSMFIRPWDTSCYFSSFTAADLIILSQTKHTFYNNPRPYLKVRLASPWIKEEFCKFWFPWELSGLPLCSALHLSNNTSRINFLRLTKKGFKQGQFCPQEAQIKTTLFFNIRCKKTILQITKSYK